ncbi:MAG: hypothetical protein WCC60_24415 [Ilumatobacteraceae bacterium]
MATGRVPTANVTVLATTVDDDGLVELQLAMSTALSAAPTISTGRDGKGNRIT